MDGNEGRAWDTRRASHKANRSRDLSRTRVACRVHSPAPTPTAVPLNPEPPSTAAAQARCQVEPGGGTKERLLTRTNGLQSPLLAIVCSGARSRMERSHPVPPLIPCRFHPPLPLLSL